MYKYKSRLYVQNDQVILMQCAESFAASQKRRLARWRTLLNHVEEILAETRSPQKRHKIKGVIDLCKSRIAALSQEAR